jgi:hypothetical protein
MGFVLNTLRRLTTRTTPATRCGWCGRTTADDVRLLSGPGVYLCAACVRDAVRHERGAEATDANAVGCQFCNRIRPALRPTGPGVVQICSACLVLLDSILSEHDVIQASAT